MLVPVVPSPKSQLILAIPLPTSVESEASKITVKGVVPITFPFSSSAGIVVITAVGG